MDLQSVFYVFGIIFMGLAIMMLVGIVALLFFIVKGIKDVSTNINDKIDSLADRATASSSLAVDLGTAVAGSVIKKAKKAFDKQHD